jgi:transketolase
MDATLEEPGPVYVRIAKGNEPAITRAEDGFAIGRAIPLRSGRDAVIISTGAMTWRALRAAELLAAQGIDAGVLHAHTVKPLDDRAVLEAAAAARLVVTLEEHSRIGGLGSAVLESLNDAQQATPVLRLALPDRFSRDYGSQEYVLEVAGLGVESIAGAVQARLEKHVLLK